MIYPNIILVNKKDSIIFYNNEFHNHEYFYDVDYLFSLIDQGWTFLIISQNLKNLSYIKKYLDKNNIKKVIFLVDDFFRLDYFDKKYTMTSTLPVEKNFKNASYGEINLVKEILKDCSISKYKIYHCEKIPTKIKKKFNLKIQYYDLFLSNWIRIQKNDLKLTYSQDFEYKVSCLNHRADIHRTIVTAVFFENRDFFYTMCNHLDRDFFFNNEEILFDNFSKDFKILVDSKCQKFYNTPLISLSDTLHIIKENKNYNYETQNSILNFYAIQNSFVNLTNETRFFTQMNYISEKTFKPIIAKRPFIMVGPKGNLKMLKSWGFKTFDKWWNEDYDTELDHNKRIEKIYHITSDILSRDVSELKSMLLEMNSVLEYNYRLYLRFNTNFYKL